MEQMQVLILANQATGTHHHLCTAGILRRKKIQRLTVFSENNTTTADFNTRTIFIIKSYRYVFQ